MSFFYKYAILRFFKIIFITILLSIVAVFRIGNCEVGKVFFLINNLIKLLPRFSIEIFEITDGSIINYFYIITYREFRGLAIFLEYNPIVFYLD